MSSDKHFAKIVEQNKLLKKINKVIEKKNKLLKAINKTLEKTNNNLEETNKIHKKKFKLLSCCIEDVTIRKCEDCGKLGIFDPTLKTDIDYERPIFCCVKCTKYFCGYCVVVEDPKNAECAECEPENA